MGNYKCRREGYLAAWEMVYAQYLFRGMDEEWIVDDLFHPGPDKKKRGYYKQKLTRIRKNPKFQEYYKSLVTEWSVHNLGKALTKLSEQIDSDQAWLANKAANDVLQRAQKMVMGEDENTVHVKIEGMPEIGVPDGND